MGAESDSVVLLNRLAQDLRNERGELSAESFLCLNCAVELQTARSRIEAWEQKLNAEDSLKRIAIALEQAALWGWGNVRGDDLGSK